MRFFRNSWDTYLVRWITLQQVILFFSFFLTKHHFVKLDIEHNSIKFVYSNSDTAMIQRKLCHSFCSIKREKILILVRNITVLFELCPAMNWASSYSHLGWFTQPEAQIVFMELHCIFDGLSCLVRSKLLMLISIVITVTILWLQKKIIQMIFKSVSIMAFLPYEWNFIEWNIWRESKSSPPVQFSWSIWK